MTHDSPEPQGDGFRQELKAVLNRHSREEGSNTPDHILANYLVACLAAFDTASRSREEWYGIKSEPTHGTVSTRSEGGL